MTVDDLCPVTIDVALQRAATLAPDVEAIVASDGRRCFADLAAEVAAARAALAAHGIRRGDHVGLCLGNGTAWVTLFFALATMGAVTVPVNTRFQADELAYALRQSRVRALFIADRFLKIDFVTMLRRVCPAVDATLPDSALPDLLAVVVLGDVAPAGAVAYPVFLAAGAGRAAAVDCRPDDTALIQYTSGTTSFPKGVMLSHRSMLANAFVSGQRMGFRTADRYHSARPFFHVAGSTLSVLSSLQHLVTLVTMDRFEAGEALQLMEAERCTHFSGNDTMALMLLDHPDRPHRRLVLRGAWAAASPAILQRIANDLGAREVVAGYGLSEASPNVAQSCWWEPAEIRMSGRMRPQPMIDVAIVDEAGEPVAAGRPGEIRVRGWTVMSGYFDQPDATAETLDVDGWLSTGDVGRMGEDGRLEFLGRAKEIIRVGGENVAPTEVEDVLHRHPTVRQAAVVGIPDPRLVEAVGAFVVASETESADPDALIAWCQERLAGFKVPRRVWIVDGFDGIGMTASAKVQKKALAAHARALMAADG